MGLIIVVGLAGGVWLGWLVLRQWRRQRRRRLRSMPLTAQQNQLLMEWVPWYRALPNELRPQLQGLINVFLAEKAFVGCAGLAISEPIRLVIAAHACLLLLNRNTDYYPGFTTILVYPDSYVARETHYEGGMVVMGESVRAGESWQQGPMVLSWNDLLRDLAEPEAGQNVALHEFAHKLDEEDGAYNGRPVLMQASQSASWARVLGQEYEALRRYGDNAGVLDAYGASSPAEFFAVATEAFFVQPALMQEAHPALYEELRRFYRLDPARWVQG